MCKDDTLKFLRSKRNEKVEFERSFDENSKQKKKKKKKDEYKDSIEEIDAFEKDTDGFEAFIDDTWNETAKLADEGEIDLMNDPELAAMQFDEANEDINENDDESDKDSNEQDTKTSNNNNNNTDEFEWLRNNIISDNDQIGVKNNVNPLEPTQESKKALLNTDDDFASIFNLSKFPNDKRNKNQTQSGTNALQTINENMSSFEREEQAIRAKIGMVPVLFVYPCIFDYPCAKCIMKYSQIRRGES